MKVIVLLRITGGRQGVSTEVAACRSDDTEPFRSFGHSGPPLPREAFPCLVFTMWQVRQNLSVRYGFLTTGLWRESSARLFKRLPDAGHCPRRTRELAHPVYYRSPSKEASKALTVTFRLHAIKPILRCRVVRPRLV